MPLISTKVHGAADYASAVAMIAVPKLLVGEDRRAAALVRAAGAGTLVASALTDYELGVRRVLPMPVHLALDAATGATLAAGGFALRRAGSGIAVLIRLAALGGGEIAGAAVTERRPGDRPASSDTLPGAAPGVTGVGLAGRTPAAAGPPIATPPIETPGPSVTPPETPESETERAQRADALTGADENATGDALLAREEAAAAAEAARIGGVVPSETGDPAMDPVYEAGGGEQDGWEAAEEALIDNATHDDGHGNPERDAFRPELESDRSGAVYGESDQLPSTEVVEDPAAGPDDPGAGPDISADRGAGMQPRQ